MKQFVSKIWNSPSARNVGKLLSANIFAQALGLLVYPILTRMYAPEDFALLSLFTSIAGVLVLFATSEYHYAIVIPKEESKARAIVHLCVLLLLALVGALLVSMPFAGYIANVFKAPELANWWWLMPLIVGALGGWNILNYWYIRCAAFTRVSGYQITQSIFSATGKIGFGALGWMQGGLILATAVAPLLSLIISVILAWKSYLRELIVVSRSEIKGVIKEYANFPKFNLPRALVNAVGMSLPVWLLTPHFGLEAVGHLSLAMMAACVPINILSRACYQVLFQKVSDLVQQQRSIQAVLTRFVLWMGIVLLVGLPIIYLFVPQLVTILFGAEWIESATIIRTLFPYLILTPICGSICFLSDVFAKQKIAMWMETGYVSAIAIALSVGIYLEDFLDAVSLFSWTRLLYLAIQLIWFIWITKDYHKEILYRK